MECTLAPARPATAPVAVSPRGLLAAFAAVPDPRRQASIDYPLPTLLALAVDKWAVWQGAAVLGPLGFAAGRRPCQSTLHRLFARLDGDALSRALSAHADQPHAAVALVVGATHARA